MDQISTILLLIFLSLYLSLFLFLSLCLYILEALSQSTSPLSFYSIMQGNILS